MITITGLSHLFKWENLHKLVDWYIHKYSMNICIDEPLYYGHLFNSL